MMPKPNQLYQRRQRVLANQRQSRAGHDFAILGNKNFTTGITTLKLETFPLKLYIDTILLIIIFSNLRKIFVLIVGFVKCLLKHWCTCSGIIVPTLRNSGKMYPGLLLTMLTLTLPFIGKMYCLVSSVETIAKLRNFL